MAVGKISLTFSWAVLIAAFSPGVFLMAMAGSFEEGTPGVPMGEEILSAAPAARVG